MADVPVEEIIAEPEEIGYLQSFFIFVHLLISSYGWYILLGGGAAYYLKNKLQTKVVNQSKSPEEIASWQAKEEQRLKAIQRLQQKYEQESAIKAEKQKLLDEQKKKARLAELEALTKKADGHILGDGGTSNSNSLRPDYNPLMGEDGGDRVCFRRPGGGSGG